MNWRLAPPGERTQAAGEAGGVGAPACDPQERPVPSVAVAPFSRSRTPSAVGGFGEAGFRATKRKDENNVPRIKAPLRKCRKSAGAGRDVVRCRTGCRYQPAEALGP